MGLIASTPAEADYFDEKTGKIEKVSLELKDKMILDELKSIGMMIRRIKHG
jgi:hypothetical protein